MPLTVAELRKEILDLPYRQRLEMYIFLYKSVDPATLASHPEWVNALGHYTEELAAFHENHASF